MSKGERLVLNASASERLEQQNERLRGKVSMDDSLLPHVLLIVLRGTPFLCLILSLAYANGGPRSSTRQRLEQQSEG